MPIFLALLETIPDARLFLAQSLGKLSTANPGKLVTMTSGVDPRAQTFLAKYLQDANVQLV